MRGHKRLVGWITAFLPKQCIPVEVSVVNIYVIHIWNRKELTDATLDAYSSYPCLDRKYVYHAKQLHNGDVITGPIHLFMSKSGVVSVACPNDRHTFCDSVKDGPMILDGWGSRCPEKTKGNWDHCELPRIRTTGTTTRFHGDRHAFCGSVKDGPMIFDGWGSRCPEKTKDSWDPYGVP
uniref:Uncharacterized protein n=1 Tax=Alexandrium monilatum TaxID=311494 RepID=A0A7S4VCK3_9DINO